MLITRTCTCCCQVGRAAVRHVGGGGGRDDGGWALVGGRDGGGGWALVAGLVRPVASPQRGRLGAHLHRIHRGYAQLHGLQSQLLE